MKRLILCLFFPLVLQAKDFVEIHVKVTQTNFITEIGEAAGIGGTISREKIYSWKARCVVGINEWLIETRFSPNAINLYYFNGTNILHLSKRIAGNPVHEIVNNPFFSLNNTTNPLSKQNVATATITPGKHPLDYFGVNLPWLAFCSGRYLQVPGRRIPLVGAEIRHVFFAFGFDDETETYQDKLGLPLKVRLSTSEKWIKTAPLNPSFIRDVRTIDEMRQGLRSPLIPYPDGFVAGQYDVIKSTLHGNWTLPTLFKYEQYSLGTDGKSKRTLAVQGVVEDIIDVDKPNLELSSNVSYAIVDYRFRHESKLVDDIRYSVTNGVIPAFDDPTLQRIFREQVAIAATNPHVSKHYRGYLVYGVILASTLILFLIVKRTSQQCSPPIKP